MDYQKMDSLLQAAFVDDFPGERARGRRGLEMMSVEMAQELKKLRAKNELSEHTFQLGSIDRRVNELSEAEVWQLCLDGDQFDREGKIGDCLLRQVTEAWLEAIGLEHDSVALRMLQFVAAAHKRRSIRLQQVEKDEAEWHRQALYHNKKHGEILVKVRRKNSAITDVVEGRGMFGVDAAQDLAWAMSRLSEVHDG